jgi:hypothetical protein
MLVAPGGLMVSVLAVGPKVCGSNPAKGDKIRSAPSFGGALKPLSHVVRFYGMLTLRV